jgi:WD40 repeat protein
MVVSISMITIPDDCYTLYRVCSEMVNALPVVANRSGLIKPVRAVAFSPEATLLAAAGDSKVISLYGVSSGEQVANLAGHSSWIMSLDFSATGEWLLSG